MIRYSAIGLLVMFVVILITPAVSAAVGFESVGQKFKPGTIFQTMRCVADRIFGKTDESCFAVASQDSGTSTTDTYSGSSSGVPQISNGSQTGNSPNGVGVWTQNL
ncbi:MAG: hypothetical protein WCK88_04895 [bacterium]